MFDPGICDRRVGMASHGVDQQGCLAGQAALTPELRSRRTRLESSDSIPWRPVTICALLAGLAGSSARRPGRRPGQGAAPDQPLEPATALTSFRSTPAFSSSRSPTEPLVTDPVSVCYDADGRLYVVEMRRLSVPGENAQRKRHAVSRTATATAGSTRGRSSSTASRGRPAIVPYDGGVFIAVAPDILYAKDTDGDGVADVKKVMFTGFGTDNVQGLLNGLLWGPDGWIYGVPGINGGDDPEPHAAEAEPVSVRGRDFRFKPDGSAFEAVSGGGQFGHSLRRLGAPVHLQQQQPHPPDRPALALPGANPALVAAGGRLDIAAEGPAAPVFRISPAEPWRVVRTRQRAADPVMAKRLPPTELFADRLLHLGHRRHHLPRLGLPPEYRGNAFIGDVGGNLVHRKTLPTDGAIFLRPGPTRTSSSSPRPTTGSAP